MTNRTPAQLYRSVLRQFVANSVHPRAERSATVLAHMRILFQNEDKIASPKLIRDAENMVVYLKAHRLHKELVERYNPTNTLSGQERARMSAGMVGLNMPKPFGDELDENGQLVPKKGSLQSIG